MLLYNISIEVSSSSFLSGLPILMSNKNRLSNITISFYSTDKFIAALMILIGKIRRYCKSPVLAVHRLLTIAVVVCWWRIIRLWRVIYGGWRITSIIWPIPVTTTIAIAAAMAIITTVSAEPKATMTAETTAMTMCKCRC